jgi:hypothetical protein
MQMRAVVRKRASYRAFGAFIRHRRSPRARRRSSRCVDSSFR